MLAVASRPEDAPPSAWQYDRRDGEECEQGAPERDLPQRIGGKFPFHNRIAPGEHRGRADHVGDPERDLAAPRRRSHICDGHRAGPFVRIFIRTPFFDEQSHTEMGSILAIACHDRHRPFLSEWVRLPRMSISYLSG